MPEENFAQCIIERIRKLENLPHAADVGPLLDGTRKEVSQWVNRRTVPWKGLFSYAQRSGWALDYLVLGRGEAKAENYRIAETGAIYEVPTNQDSVYALAGMVYDALQEARMEISRAKFQDLLRILHRDLLASQSSEMPYQKVVAMLRLLLPDK